MRTVTNERLFVEHQKKPLYAAVLWALLMSSLPAIAQEFREGFDHYPHWETQWDDADPGGLWYQNQEREHDVFRIEVNGDPAPWVTTVADPNHMLVVRPADEHAPMSSELEVPLGIVPIDGHVVLTELGDPTGAELS